ncbi:MAG: hypothetical protein GAK34_02961 [Delftia tsuruhatensis]|nr:MAG: hypothetical protein GAK34_02961 [Delftia tsuruhatensis]
METAVVQPARAGVVAIGVLEQLARVAVGVAVQAPIGQQAVAQAPLRIPAVVGRTFGEVLAFAVQAQPLDAAFAVAFDLAPVAQAIEPSLGAALVGPGGAAACRVDGLAGAAQGVVADAVWIQAQPAAGAGLAVGIEQPAAGGDFFRLQGVGGQGAVAYLALKAPHAVIFGAGRDAPGLVMLQRHGRAIGLQHARDVAAAAVPAQPREVVLRRASVVIACQRGGQRPVDVHQHAAAVDLGVAVARAAFDGRGAVRIACGLALGIQWAEARLGDLQRLAAAVVADADLVFAPGHDAGPGDEFGRVLLPGVLAVAVAHLQLRGPGLALCVGDAVHGQRAAEGVQLGARAFQRAACGIEPRGVGQAPLRVVPVAHVAGAAAGAARAAHFKQSPLPADGVVVVGGCLPKAVGEGVLPGLAEVQGDFFLLAVRRAAHAQDGAAGVAVGVAGDALVHGLAVAALALDADAGEQGGVARVLIVVVALDRGLAIGRWEADLHEAGVQLGLGLGAAGQRCAAVAVVDAAQRGVDGLHAGEAALARSLGVVQAQAAALRVGDLEQAVALGVVVQADLFARGQADAGQAPPVVEAQLAPVHPLPGVVPFLAGLGFLGALCIRAFDAHDAVARLLAGAQAGMLAQLAEDDAGAVGLHDLQVGGVVVQAGLVAEQPAAAEQAWRHVGPAVAAVVVAHDFQAEHAWQGGHVHFALVFVAVDEVDGVACALVGAAGVALGGGAGAAAGAAAGRGGAGAAARAATAAAEVDAAARAGGAALHGGVAFAGAAAQVGGGGCGGGLGQQ